MTIVDTLDVVCEVIKESSTHEISNWNKTAEMLCKYTDKGSHILVEGKLAKNEYVNKNGNKIQKMFIHVERIEFLSFKNKGTQDE